MQNANEIVAIAFVAMAQTVPVLLGGLDLSVGAVMTLANCIASELVTGSPAADRLRHASLTLAAGAAFGFMNGLIVVYGRIQPIIATLATGAIAIGLALFIRPTPGGSVDDDLTWALTNALSDFADTYGLFDGGDAAWFQPFAGIPVPLVLLVARRASSSGCRSAARSPAAPSTPSARPRAPPTCPACRSPAPRSPPSRWPASSPACGGLYLAIQTSSGNADVTQAGAYTLNSIAAVVLGGTSLLGGIGGAIGSIFGALDPAGRSRSTSASSRSTRCCSR